MNEGVTGKAFEEKLCGYPIEALYIETLRKLKEQELLPRWLPGRIAPDRQGDENLAN